MDTWMAQQLRQSDEDLEREFVAFCRRTLVGLPEAEGMKLAQELLASYNAFLAARAIKVRRHFSVH